MKNTRIELVAGLILVALAVMTRFLPHPPNFSPVLGIALFSGSVFTNKRLAFIFPLAALFVSDLILGSYEGMSFVYLSYALIIAMGMFMKSRQSIQLVVNGTLASILFFTLSNLGVWFSAGLYEKSLAGLTQCFVMALPFFNNTLISTLFTVFVLFIARRYVLTWGQSFKSGTAS